MAYCVKNILDLIKWLVFIIVLQYSCATDNPSNKHKHPDFIIVGGGLSGCVVAGRLSEKYSVILLEAGEDPGDILDIPVLGDPNLSKTVDYPSITKTYNSVPQKNAALRLPNNGQTGFIIGTTLGGGSSVNGMVFNRGSPYDYENWANVTNDPSWNYENLLKYFKRMEDYQGGFPSDQNHGKGGPLTISSPKYAPGLEAWLEAGKWLMFNSNVDPNGPQVPSFTPVEFSRKFGRRVNAYTAYVKPYLSSRPHLKIVTQAVVKRIIFDNDKTRAIGVTYELKNEEGITINVYANKEVIISAGVMDSPAILMRSGIGPKDVLETSNIPPVKILPVGYNLQDHVIVKMEFLLDKNASENVLVVEQDLTPGALKIYEETGDGPYSTFGLAAQAFLVSEVRKRERHSNTNWPDIHIVQVHRMEKVPENDLSVYVLPILGRPKSVGRLSLNHTYKDGPPVIDFNFLSDPEDHDMLTLVEAVKMTLKIYEEAPSFQKMGARFSKVPYQPCSQLEFRSDDYWRCWIRHMASCALHAGGTCRMGSGESDKYAVVDFKLKVIGIDGLRVVDLSIMPNVTNTNTQAAAYVIAEKASDMILQYYESRKDEL